MNPATHGSEDNAAAPVLYMALELSNESWRLAFGDGTKRRQGPVPAADLAKLAEAVAVAWCARRAWRKRTRGAFTVNSSG